MEKKVKKKAVPPVNRQVAQLMINIMDELRLLDVEIKKSKYIQNKILAKLIIMETQQCLGETLKLVLSK